MSHDNSNTILVVDDDPYVLESASTLLGEYAYNVISCSSAEEAIKQLLVNDVILVLTDIKMPGRS